MLQYVTVDMGAVTPESPYVVPGVPPLCRSGFATFSYGTHEGPLHPILWRQSIIVPEAIGATGVNVYTGSYNTYTVSLQGQPGQGLSIATVSGLLNLVAGIVGGITQGAPGENTDTGTQFVDGVTAPSPANSIFWRQVACPRVVGIGDTQSIAKDVNTLLTALAFTSEIAQWCVGRNIAETESTYPSLSGSVLTQPTSGTVRYAKLDIFATPDSNTSYWGKTGLRKLGYAAFEHDGFYEEPYYLNTTTLYAQPRLPGATGFYLLLDPGVKANLTLGINEFIATSTFTSLGEINFLAGITKGLIPKP
jgi:hypothetical protein